MGNMGLGDRIRLLRAQRGVTQETVATALGVSAQAVSKWENDVAAPDIQLLPAISSYFGVTIDELFALTDETRMERIENMLDSKREVDDTILDREAAFLFEKARREPANSQVWSLLAYMENHRADAHKRRAAEYAKGSLSRRTDNKAALWELARAYGIQGPYWELADSHRAIIDYLKDFIEKDPTVITAYKWLIDALLADSRSSEAMEVCEKLSEVDDTILVPHYRGLIAWRSGDRARALEFWQQMVRDFPDDEYTWGYYAEGYAMTGDYAGAAELFDKCKGYMTKPRSTWAWEQGAYYRELAGDIPGAIASLEELLEIRASDFGYTGDAGEEAYRGEIERLKRKLGQH